MVGARKEIMLPAVMMAVLAASLWSCSQGSRLARFEETLKKASDGDKFVVLDISASW